jgi:hypothetical protein
VPPLGLLNGEASLHRFADHSSALRWMASEAGVVTDSPVELAKCPPPDRSLTSVGTEAPRSAV